MTLNPASLGNPANLWIGRSEFSDPFLNGTVDEFQIFNRALSQAEVSSLQGSAAGTTGGGNVAWYRFDETGGATAVDSSANGRDATIVPVPNPADWVPTFPGYLGAIPDDLVLRLGPPRFATYGGDSGTWAPWYVQHKLMRGLLDCYEIAGSEQALEVVETMADWANQVLTIGDKNNPDYPGPITRDNLNLMWDNYIAGEFGASNEPLAEIYGLTGDPKHLETAKFFDNRESLFGACLANTDILDVTTANNPGPRRPNRLHANQHIPQNLGYLRIFERTGERDYYQVAKNFFDMIVPHRMYAVGGTGGDYPGSNDNIEQFQNRDNVANALTQSGSETEATHSLLQVARNLFFHEPDAALMDYYERGTVNQIAGSRADSDSTADPLITYYQPQSPGTRLSYDNLGTGDGGAGLMDQTKYQEAIYTYSADGSGPEAQRRPLADGHHPGGHEPNGRHNGRQQPVLWVNLYIASTLTWAEQGFTITQETAFPRGDTSRLTIGGRGPLTIKLRVPAWAVGGIQGQGKRVHPASPGQAEQLLHAEPELEAGGHGRYLDAVQHPYRARDRSARHAIDLLGPGADADPRHLERRRLPGAEPLPGSQAGRRLLAGGHHPGGHQPGGRPAVRHAGTVAAPVVCRRLSATVGVFPAGRARDRVRLDRLRRPERQAGRRASQLQRPGRGDHLAGDRRTDVPRCRLGPGAVLPPRAVRLDGQARRRELRGTGPVHQRAAGRCGVGGRERASAACAVTSRGPESRPRPSAAWNPRRSALGTLSGQQGTVRGRGERRGHSRLTAEGSCCLPAGPCCRALISLRSGRGRRVPERGKVLSRPPAWWRVKVRPAYSGQNLHKARVVPRREWFSGGLGRGGRA